MNTLANKTLVYKKENQQKQDMVPLEYFQKYHPEKIEEFKAFISNNYKIKDRKKSLYLVKALSEVDSEFTEGSLEDTRFITKYLVGILANNLKFADGENRTCVKSYKAGYVNDFKKACKINHFTHSLESADYRRKSELVISNFEYKKDNGIKLDAIDLVNNVPFSAEVKKQKENDKTSEVILELNKQLAIVHENNHLIDIEQIVDAHLQKRSKIDIDIFDILHEKLAHNDDALHAFEYVISYLKSQITKQTLKKNRDNHLHHALDAIATAVMTPKVEGELARYNIKCEEIIEKLNKQGMTQVAYGEVTKIVKTVDDFRALENKCMNQFIPLPYDNFIKEVQAFIYELDVNEKERMLKEMNDGKLKEEVVIKPFIPVQTKKRRYQINGKQVRVQSLHKDTVYGVSGDNTTRRIEATSLDKKKVEKIVGKDSNSKTVYEACKKWLETGKITTYPQMPNGRDIKKVKITDGDRSKALNVGRGYVAADDTVRIDVYKKEGEERFYFLQQNALTITQDHQGKEIEQILWYGQGAKKINITNNQIKEQYSCILKLHPGDLIELTKDSGECGLAYVTGFTDGKMEIKSVLGDNLDLVRDFGIKITSTRVYVTVSTIAKIQLKRINIRGEIK